MINAHDIPHDGYWTIAGQVFCYPLVTVFAASKAEADVIAGPDALDAKLMLDAHMDSAEAQVRLRIFGRPDLAAAMDRGDER